MTSLLTPYGILDFEHVEQVVIKVKKCCLLGLQQLEHILIPCKLGPLS